MKKVEKYYSNGNKWFSVSLKDEKYSGEYIEYYDNQNIKLKCVFRNGKLNGIVTGYYPDNSIFFEGKFQDNHSIEEQRLYYPNGNVCSLLYFHNLLAVNKNISRKRGIGHSYHIFTSSSDELKLCRFTTPFDGGGWNETNEMYANIHIKLTGNLASSIDFYNNGQVHEICSYSNYKMVGLTLRYYKNGKLEYKGRYIDDLKKGWGVEDGMHLHYHENGQLCSKIYWKSGKVVDGDYEDYNDDGSVRRAYTYTNNKIPLGKWKT